MRKVGIFGGSKFIGTFITLKFLAEDFHVKVQVSDKKNEEKDKLFQNISTNQNLEICKNTLSTIEDYENFVDGCDVLVHCGNPFQLDVESSEIPIFVPIINGIGNLMKTLQKNESVKKVIFVSSAMAFNPNYSISESYNFNDSNHLQIDKAKFHAQKALNTMLNNFPKDLFQVVFISPVEVKNHILSNSSKSTSSGLQFLFRKKNKPDPVFQKLLGRQVIDRLTNIEDLPDKVFGATQTKNGQLATHF